MWNSFQNGELCFLFELNSLNGSRVFLFSQNPQILEYLMLALYGKKTFFVIQNTLLMWT